MTQENMHKNLHVPRSEKNEFVTVQRLTRVPGAGLEPGLTGEKQRYHAVSGNASLAENARFGPLTCTRTCTFREALRGRLRTSARHHADNLIEHPQGGV